MGQVLPGLGLFQAGVGACVLGSKSQWCLQHGVGCARVWGLSHSIGKVLAFKQRDGSSTPKAILFVCLLFF